MQSSKKRQVEPVSSYKFYFVVPKCFKNTLTYEVDFWTMLLFNCVCVHSSSSSSSVCCSKFQSLFDLELFSLLVSTFTHALFPTTSFLTVRTCQQSIMPDLHLGIRNTRQSMDKLRIVLHDTGYIHLPNWHWGQSTLVGQFVLYKGLLGFCASRPSRQIYHFMKLGVWPKSLKIQ